MNSENNEIRYCFDVSVHRLSFTQIYNKEIQPNKGKEAHPHRTHREIEIDPITITLLLVETITITTIV